MALYAAFHRTPTVSTQEKAWTQVGVNALIQAKADAVAARKAYREFLVRLEALRGVVRWMEDKNSTLNFNSLCDELGVDPEDARDKILQSGPTDIIEFLTESHATCPLCQRMK